MPWPIPQMLKIERPTPISLRAWLPMLVAIASACAGAVLLMWPQARSTNEMDFWLVLIGAPLIACCLIFGVRRSRWDDEQIAAEAAEQEQARIVSLWRDWARRHLRVTSVLALSSVRTADFADGSIELPVNTDRAKALTWKHDAQSKITRTQQLWTAISTKIANELANQAAVEVTLLLDGASAPEAANWGKDLQRALERAAPAVRFSVATESNAACARWIATQVDTFCDSTRLLVAAQLWGDDDVAPTFTEGVAAFLIEPNAGVADRMEIDGEQPIGRIFRPMLSQKESVQSDIAQLLEMQAAPERPIHFWHSGCDTERESAIQSALSGGGKESIVEHAFDRAVGLPGPKTSWIMLAAALEAFQQDSKRHLLAWCDSADGQLSLCMIAPKK
ncbi:hypothetical protein A9R05_30370 [Burkholderia sp. KK1]|nr:hypothetical protein A9R05_30370 [Burkholderia sp. KK1]